MRLTCSAILFPLMFTILYFCLWLMNMHIFYEYIWKSVHFTVNLLRKLAVKQPYGYYCERNVAQIEPYGLPRLWKCERSKTEDNRRTQGNAGDDIFLTEGPIDKAVKRVFKATGVHSNCSVVQLYFFSLYDVIIQCGCLDLFELAKIIRWHEYNADNFKTLPIRLLCAYRMTKYIGKISLLNSKRFLRKLQKILMVYFLPDKYILK